MKVLIRVSGTKREANKAAIFSFLEIIRKRVIQDQSGKKIYSSGKSAQSLDIVEVKNGGQLIGADYFQQQITGRKPGKFPHIQPIIDWIDSKGLKLNKINKKSLAFVIARKIANQGTDIFKKKRQGLAFNQIVNDARPILTDQLIKAGKIEIKTSLTKALKGVKSQNLRS